MQVYEIPPLKNLKNLILFGAPYATDVAPEQLSHLLGAP